MSKSMVELIAVELVGFLEQPLARARRPSCRSFRRALRTVIGRAISILPSFLTRLLLAAACILRSRRPRGPAARAELLLDDFDLPPAPMTTAPRSTRGPAIAGPCPAGPCAASRGRCTPPAFFLSSSSSRHRRRRAARGAAAAAGVPGRAGPFGRRRRSPGCTGRRSAGAISFDRDALPAGAGARGADRSSPA